jgi:Fic family protein
MPHRRVQLVWQYNPTLYAPARYRRACRYEAFIPAFLSETPLALPMSVAGIVSDAEHAIRTLNGAVQPALAPLARLLLRTESIASSKVEGLQVGVRELARAESKRETGNKIGTTALEVIANIDAMRLAVDEAASVDVFGVQQIRLIHARLMASSSTTQRIAGKLRDTQNWIGGNDHNPCGADFVPPPPEYVAELLDDLCTAVNDESLPPIVQAALVHAQFETIHPFDDGNGRTGRALVQVVLRRRGLAPDYVPPISVVLANAKERYIAGLTAFREERVAEWIEQFAIAAASAATLARAYTQRVSSLVTEWRERLNESETLRSDAAAWAVIDVLPGYPVITAAAAAAATARSKPSIYDALRQLQHAAVLAPLSSSARNQSWEAVGLLELLENLEAGRAPVAH